MRVLIGSGNRCDGSASRVMEQSFDRDRSTSGQLARLEYNPTTPAARNPRGAVTPILIWAAPHRDFLGELVPQHLHRVEGAWRKERPRVSLRPAKRPVIQRALPLRQGPPHPVKRLEGKRNEDYAAIPPLRRDRCQIRPPSSNPISSNAHSCKVGIAEVLTADASSSGELNE